MGFVRGWSGVGVGVGVFGAEANVCGRGVERCLCRLGGCCFIWRDLIRTLRR